MRRGRTITAGGTMLRRPARVATWQQARSPTAGRAATMLRRVAASPARVRTERPSPIAGAPLGRLGTLTHSQGRPLGLPSRPRLGQLMVPARGAAWPGVAA